MWIANDVDKDSLKATISSNGKQTVSKPNLHPCILTYKLLPPLSFQPGLRVILPLLHWPIIIIHMHYIHTRSYIYINRVAPSLLFILIIIILVDDTCHIIYNSR